MSTISLAAAALSLLLAGCDRQQDKHDELPPKGSEVFLIGPGPENARWPAVVAGARQAMQRYPYLRLRLLTPQPGSGTTVSSLIERAISQGASAIALWIDNETGHDIELEAAQRRGIVLVTMNDHLPNSPGISHVDVNMSEGAARLGQRLPEIADGHISYVLLHARGRDPVATACHDRFLERARNHSSIHELTERNLRGTDQTPQELVDEMLGLFPSASLVITLDRDLWGGLRPGISLPETSRFVALSAAPALWPALRDGKAAALAGPLDGDIGRAAIELIASELASEQEDTSMRVIECEVVTPANLDDFARRYADAAGIPLADLPIAIPTTQPASAPGDG
ncbi:MAG: substrate-binding domain-containing protein [Phycisphaerae bacterium]|nr:substrate-binding domain-containing protein [Phycisphaerae bacterium]